jgi:hypothetical protein
LLVGYSEGLESERRIAWRAGGGLAVRSFVGLGFDEAASDHSRLRARGVVDVETHGSVFIWVQERPVTAGLLAWKTVAIDGTTLEANASTRRIVRRHTGETYQRFLTRVAAASGINTATRETTARQDRRRKKWTSNAEWPSPPDPDAKVRKMKDGRPHHGFNP